MERKKRKKVYAQFVYLFFALYMQIPSSASMSGMHSISSSEDIKPPFGMRPMPAHSPGVMMSQKRLCVICGDRSSGEFALNTCSI